MGWKDRLALWSADASTVETWDRRVAQVDLTAVSDGELRDWYSTALAKNDAISAGNQAIIAELKRRNLGHLLDTAGPVAEAPTPAPAGPSWPPKRIAALVAVVIAAALLYLNVRLPL